MDSLDAWLAAMPVQDVDRRIEQLEGELEILRTLKRQRARVGSVGAGPAPDRVVSANNRIETGSASEVLKASGTAKRARRLSPERAAIIRQIRDQPEGMSPADVTLALKAQGIDADQNAIQTTMSRMARAGQLLRVEYGNYRLPSHSTAASLLHGSAGGEEG